MLRRERDDDANGVFERRVTEDGRCEVVATPVMFGMRVRAGESGTMCYNVDICVGDNREMLEAVYALVAAIIEEHGVDLPWPVARIKPVWRDPDFMVALLDLAGLQVLELDRDDRFPRYDLAPTAEMRAAYFARCMHVADHLGVRVDL